MRLTLKLTGTSPLLMHNPRMVDPNFDLNREIKALTGKRKKTDADCEAIERLEWFGGIYEENGIVVQPTSKVRKCLINTGKIFKMGTSVTRAVNFVQLNVPLIYDGPKEIESLWEIEQFRSRLSVGIGGKRVMRMRPKFFPWALSLDCLFIDDAGLNYEEFLRIVELAGLAEGIGDNRVNGYGRFTAEVVRHG